MLLKVKLAVDTFVGFAGPLPIVGRGGTVLSMVKVPETAAAVFPALSVARARSVYAPSAGKFAAENVHDHAVVPVATKRTSLALPNDVPFQ
ncbi:MAG: hypothetical protein E6J17_03255 [Chloroflexi bacterium]|nr:MAG: hypothetical protein E6J17_03255 [Chloroflexota bacterium]